MGRKSQFTDEQVFTWLASRLVASPHVSIQELSEGTGVSVGSIYHRYGSLDGLLGSAFISAGEAFYPTATQELQGTGRPILLNVAMQAYRLATINPVAATLLFAVPRGALVGPGLPAELRAHISARDSAFVQTCQKFWQRSDISFSAGEQAMLTVPQAIVARYLPGGPIPDTARQFILRCANGILGLGLRYEP